MFCKLVSWGLLLFEQKAVFLCQEMHVLKNDLLILTSL